MTRVVRVIVIVVLTSALAVAVVRATASLRTVYELDTRLWFLQLKLRGDVPTVGWLEALRRVGPGWPRRDRFDVARAIGRGDTPCSVLWETPLGRFWGTAQDGRELDLLSLEQAGGDIYEQRDVTIRAGDVVIDVGAHLGTFTKVALARSARLVVAIEPDPVNAACLARTFAPEIAAGRVRLVEAAAWSSTGSLEFEVGDASQTGHVAPPESTKPARNRARRTLTVRAVALDDLIDQLRLDRVNFVKMDIEGAERHALAGARRLLGLHKPRLAICIYHGADDREVVPKVTRAANDSYRSFRRGGFQMYFY